MGRLNHPVYRNRVLQIAADAVLVARLEAAGRRAIAAALGPPGSAVIAGSGEFLARRLARRLLPASALILSLRTLWSPDDSTAACARALLILAREDADSGGGRSSRDSPPDPLVSRDLHC